MEHIYINVDSSSVNHGLTGTGMVFTRSTEKHVIHETACLIRPVYLKSDAAELWGIIEAVRIVARRSGAHIIKCDNALGIGQFEMLKTTGQFKPKLGRRTWSILGMPSVLEQQEWLDMLRSGRLHIKHTGRETAVQRVADKLSKLAHGAYMSKTNMLRSLTDTGQCVGIRWTNSAINNAIEQLTHAQSRAAYVDRARVALTAVM